ncbi:MAG: hypothetical protein U0795_03300 [Pirellulales bacterium]
MVARRQVCQLIAGCALSWLLARPAFGQTPAIRVGASQVSLRDQLARGLRARRQAEFAFVDQVVSQVNQGHLPLSLVQSTYLWARKKTPYPFPYFMVALSRRAKAIGVDLNSDVGS